MTGSVTKAAVLLSPTPTRRRVLALPAPELGMLMRFALLRQLHGAAGDAAPSAPAHQLTTMAAATYVASRGIEELERLSPFLDALASDWIRQRRLS